MVVVAMLVLAGVPQTPKAQWIWASGASVPKHVCFRRNVELMEVPAKAKLTVTCDDAYVLYINGNKVASHASWYTMQTVDLRPLLHKGKNTIAVEAQNYESEAGLLVVGQIGKTSISTDRLWKASVDAPDGWLQPGFDDSKWTEPKIIGPVGIGPWGQPRDEQEEVQRMRALKPAKPLRIDKAAPKSYDPARAFIWAKKDTGLDGGFRQMPIMPVAGAEAVGKTIDRPTDLVFDFGRELAGWVEVTVESKSQPKADIVVSEASDGFFAPPTVAIGKNGRYTFYLAPVGGYTGFRYAKVQFKYLPSPAKIVDVRAVYRLWPANYTGNFSCSDQVLNDIWELGAYTVRLNLDPKGLGAVLRNERSDRFPWMGDDRVAHRTLFVCFGLYDYAKVDFDTFVKPGTKPIDLNGIPGYTLDWVIGLYNYWTYSGDFETVKKHLADVRTIIEQYDSTQTPQGWLFTDWEPELINASDKSVAAFHTKYVHAALLAEKMALAFGEQAMAKAFRDAASRRLSFLGQRADWPNKLPVHALVNAVFAGNADQYGADVPETTITPYYTSYLLDAISQTGQDERALKALRAYYKGMLDLGATSAWEYFTLDWLKTLKPGSLPPDMSGAFVSLCHPWSSGATTWLSEHVLGVTPAAPGYTVCQIKPFFGSLEWAKGAVPTPNGVVRVEWRKDSAGYRLVCSTPRGIKVKLVPPKGYRCTIDGRTNEADGSVLVDGGREIRVVFGR